MLPLEQQEYHLATRHLSDQEWGKAFSTYITPIGKMYCAAERLLGMWLL
jgi:hypothetical protein